MSYQLGIDLGTTYTAAAICRGGVASIVPLGTRAAVIPSVLFCGNDGTVLTGDAANRRAVTEADRVAREFKRRIGDPTPLVVGGAPYSAEALAARLLRWIVGKVSEAEGGPPQRVAITYPASWGPYKQEAFERAAQLAGLGEVMMLTEPEAAALSYASAERVDAGSTVAVYDLGGGTFDAVVLRKAQDGFDLLGAPEGIERLGGIDFDETVFAHVTQALGPRALEQLDPDDPMVLEAVARVRRECVDAKEALSSDTDTSIPVLLPHLQTQVRLVRSEFEAMIRPAVAETIAALRRAVRSAGVEPQDLRSVLLVGGSSRIPLVAQMVSAEFGRPIALDTHPKHATALGAALAAGGHQAPRTGIADAAPASAVRPPTGESPAAPPVAPVAPVAMEPPARPPVAVPCALQVPGGAAAAAPPGAPRSRRPGERGGYLPVARGRHRSSHVVSRSLAVLVPALLIALAALPVLQKDATGHPDPSAAGDTVAAPSTDRATPEPSALAEAPDQVIHQPAPAPAGASRSQPALRRTAAPPLQATTPPVAPTPSTPDPSPPTPAPDLEPPPPEPPPPEPPPEPPPPEPPPPEPPPPEPEPEPSDEPPAMGIG